MPGLVKIGSTKNNVEERRKQLSSPTAVPPSYKVEGVYNCIFGNPTYWERVLHKHLSVYREDKSDFKRNRPEFFRLTPHEARERIRRYFPHDYDDYDQKSGLCTGFTGLSKTVSRDVMDGVWESRRADFCSGLQNELDDILPNSFQTGYMDWEYIPILIEKFTNTVRSYELNCVLNVVELDRTNLFVEIFSHNYLIYFGVFFVIGRTVMGEYFEAFHPMASRSGKSYKSKEPYLDILSRICERILQEEQEIISYINGLHSLSVVDT